MNRKAKIEQRSQFYKLIYCRNCLNLKLYLEILNERNLNDKNDHFYILALKESNLIYETFSFY